MTIQRSTEYLDVLTPEGSHRMAWTQWQSSDSTDQPLILCVHGLTRNARDFDFVAQRLAQHGRVICPDILGRGDSDWLRTPGLYGYPLYVSQMQQLLTYLYSAYDQSSCRWLGTSMGGLIGMMLAATPGSGIRQLIMNDIGPLIPLSALQRLGEYVGKAPMFDTRDQAERYLRKVAAPFGPLTDEQWQHLAEHGTEPCENQLRLRYDPSIGEAFSQLTGDVDLSMIWQAVSCPVLVIRGGESDLLSAATARSMLQHPDTQLVEFPGVGHAPMLMARDQIHAVEHFLFG